MRFTSFLVCTLLLLTSYSYANTDRFTDAMEIAIQHFSADASKEIKAWGPEHTVAYKALLAIDAKIPAVKSISIGVPLEKFTTLRHQSKYGTSREALSLGIIETTKSLDPIVSKCKNEIETKTIERNSGASVTKEKTTTYNLDRFCASALADALVEAGINQIKFQTKEGSYNDHYAVSFSQTVNTYRDMRFVKKQIQAIAGIDLNLVEKLAPLSSDGMIIGKSTDLNLENSNGKAQLGDAITLIFFQGWGDCPAGCIEKHWWKIQSKQITEDKFEVTLLKEWGSKLP